MSKGFVGVLLVGLAACGLGIGCGGGGEKKEGEAAAPESVGVAECDEYLKKMEACIATMPPETKAAQEQAFKQSRETWKKTAETESGKQGLQATCKASLDAYTNNPMCK